MGPPSARKVPERYRNVPVAKNWRGDPTARSMRTCFLMAFGKSTKSPPSGHRSAEGGGEGCRAHARAVHGEGAAGRGAHRRAGVGWGGAAQPGRWPRPRFQLQEATFTGLSRASRAELVRLSGLAAGQNLFAHGCGGAGEDHAPAPVGARGGGDAALPGLRLGAGGGAPARGAGGAGGLVRAGRGGRALQAGDAGRRAGLAARHGRGARCVREGPGRGARADARGAGGGALVRGAQAWPPRAAVRGAGGGHGPGAGDDGRAGGAAGGGRIPRPSCRGCRACGAS